VHVSHSYHPAYEATDAAPAATKRTVTFFGAAHASNEIEIRVQLRLDNFRATGCINFEGGEIFCQSYALNGRI
jgi:hypothetical protein